MKVGRRKDRLEAGTSTMHIDDIAGQAYKEHALQCRAFA